MADDAARDAAFRDRTITVMALLERLHGPGALQGELRAVDLRTPIEQAEILSAGQIAAYNRPRGYDAPRDATAEPAPPRRRGAH